MQLISKTYWGGAPMNMRRPPDAFHLESLILKAPDFREHRALYWTPKKNPKPKTGIVVMHPRADFTHHYIIPRLVDAGVACLGANSRNPNNDVTTIHEEIILDVASAVSFLKRRGIQNVVLVGNSGGGALNGFYQSQARKPKGERVAKTPGGRRTHLNDAMNPADGMIYISTHRGEGMIMNEIIDPSVVDETQPHLTDPSLDMYDERNGFRTPSKIDGSDAAWSRYDEAFLKRHRAAQIERVKRIDAIARAMTPRMSALKRCTTIPTSRNDHPRNNATSCAAKRSSPCSPSTARWRTRTMSTTTSTRPPATTVRSSRRARI
jgi:hypothetical protein